MATGPPVRQCPRLVASPATDRTAGWRQGPMATRLLPGSQSRAARSMKGRPRAWRTGLLPVPASAAGLQAQDVPRTALLALPEPRLRGRVVLADGAVGATGVEVGLALVLQLADDLPVVRRGA